MRSPSAARERPAHRPAPAVVEADRGWVAFLLLYLGLGATIALVWTRITDFRTLPSWHMDMLGGTAPAPNQYRPLTPYLAEAIRTVLPDQSVYTAYLILRGAVTGVALFVFDRYLRTWFTGSAAAAGAFCLAAVIPFTFFRVVQESDPTNLLVFVLAFWALALGRDLLLIPLVLLGTLNRETVAMIPALYLTIRWGREQPRQLAWRTLALGASWAAVYGGLLLHYGRRGYYCDVVMLPQNLASLSPTVLLFLMFGGVWVFACMARRTAPEMLRRALWLVPPFLVLHYVIAMVNEVRLFLPLAPILIPLAWWVLFPNDRVAPAGARRG